MPHRHDTDVMVWKVAFEIVNKTRLHMSQTSRTVTWLMLRRPVMQLQAGASPFGSRAAPHPYGSCWPAGQPRPCSHRWWGPPAAAVRSAAPAARTPPCYKASVSKDLKIRLLHRSSYKQAAAHVNVLLLAWQISSISDCRAYRSARPSHAS